MTALSQKGEIRKNCLNFRNFPQTVFVETFKIFTFYVIVFQGLSTKVASSIPVVRDLKVFLGLSLKDTNCYKSI